MTNVTEEHYGNYTCVAANNLGVTNASLVLFSKYAKVGPDSGEFSQVSAPVDSLKSIPLPHLQPYLLKVNIHKNKNPVTETKTQDFNPYA